MKYSRAAATFPTPAQFPRISTIDGDSQQRASQRDDLTSQERENDHGSDARRPSRDLKAPHSRPSR